MIKNIKWCSDNTPDASSKSGSQPIDLMDYYEYIMEHVSFVQLLKRFKLKPEGCSTGTFTHRMICPFKFHKRGRERTPSFRLNENKKTFMCFGCLERGDILKFMQLYCGGYEQYNLERLSAMFNLAENGNFIIPENYIIPQEEIRENNYKIRVETGLVLRDYLKEIKGTKIYQNECNWADDTLIKIDKCFDEIDSEDLESSKEIYAKIKISIDKRKKKHITPR
jgi:CHC2 zinc finger